MKLALEQNVPLAPFTTLGIGGPARWFVTAHHEDEVREAVRIATEDLHVPLFVLGGGSNLLVADTGFPGLVLHLQLRGVTVSREITPDPVHVTAAAGESWDDLVQFTVDRNLQGMECLAGIPGSVGGTPIQNVGAYGQDIAQTFVSARCFDTTTQAIVDLHAAQLGFAYRTSLLNTTERGRYIVLAVTFALHPGGAPNLSYADLKRAFPAGTNPTLPQVAGAVRTIRRAKGMVVDPADPDSRSAGSFFRNPIVPATHLAHLAQATGLSESDIPHWPTTEGTLKLPAAWLLEHAGFPRGTTLGNAAISSKHTLALINRGNATHADIATLRNSIIQTVEQTFALTLEQEPVNLP